MSDHDAAPDPSDKAYAQAEALLSDDGGRAARRARVLAAVAEATVGAAAPPPPPAWRRAGWLVAASVAGLSAILATKVYSPPSVEPTAPTPPAVPAITADSGIHPPPPAAGGPPETPILPPRRSAPAPEAPAPARDMARVEPSSPPLPVAQARPKAPLTVAPETPSSQDSLSEVVVTGSRMESAREEPRAGWPADSSTGLAARLRDAAADGRTAEVAALLARGVPVDGADDDGETALMKSIRANQPAAAALLRRHGASLDRKNRMGESVRDMATSIGDVELNRALSLDR